MEKTGWIGAHVRLINSALAAQEIGMTGGSEAMAGDPEIGGTALVSVVIPAYNGEETIDETLRSVRSQTHTNLEIIVIDDGSTDATGVIAARHATLDPRLRVVRQANAGVAAARNHGWRIAASSLIAFIDADDLWSADKIERQLAALRAMPEAGLVYSGYVIIDAASHISLQWEHIPHQGDVLRQLLIENFVGNGSAVLVRRQALVDVGGFEPRMRAADAGGCEDILFYSRVAERYAFALATGNLVGYRFSEGNMSSDLARMLRSWMLMQEELAPRHPDKRSEINRGFDRFARWLVRRAIEVGQYRQLPRLAATIARRSWVQAFAIVRSEVPRALRDFGWPSRRNRMSNGPRFEIGTPDHCSSNLDAEQVGKTLQL